MKIRIATRQSILALTQTRWVSARLHEVAPDIQIEEVMMTTRGDEVQDRPLREVGGKGLFVAEIEAALVRGDADLAVHSMKDIPGDVELADGMDILCVPAREDPGDVLVTRDGEGLMDLKAGSRVGTTSLRRVCQLKQQRLDLDYRDLRGNLQTRLGKLDDGQYDAIVLAAAGLNRLDLLETRPHQRLPLEYCIPAVGQGALAIEGAVDNEALKTLVSGFECSHARLVTTAERNLLRHLQGNCQVPIAGHAMLSEDGSRLSMIAMVGNEAEDQILSAASDTYLPASDSLEAARALGIEVADALLGQGAGKVMQEAAAAAAKHQHTGNGGGSRDGWKYTTT